MAQSAYADCYVPVSETQRQAGCSRNTAVHGKDTLRKERRAYIQEVCIPYKQRWVQAMWGAQERQSGSRLFFCCCCLIAEALIDKTLKEAQSHHLIFQEGSLCLPCTVKHRHLSEIKECLRWACQRKRDCPDWVAHFVFASITLLLRSHQSGFLTLRTELNENISTKSNVYITAIKLMDTDRGLFDQSSHFALCCFIIQGAYIQGLMSTSCRGKLDIRHVYVFYCGEQKRCTKQAITSLLVEDQGKTFSELASFT